MIVSTRHEFDRCGTHFRREHRRDVLRVAPVFGAVCSVDLIVEAGIGFRHEGDVFFDATGPDAAFVPHLSRAKPRTVTSPSGADIEIVADADDPDRHRFARCTVASKWRDQTFVCRSDSGEFVIRPQRH